MEITKAEFLQSNTSVHKCLPPDRHEYAFIGRSNVGKSSLINMLTRRKSLAKVANKPGKTQLINHFLINDSWYLVDLPGYGYAQISASIRDGFKKMIQDYILKRENLICLFVLVDCRHKPQKIDLEFMEWLGENGVPFVMVFTKADKLGTVQQRTCVQEYQNKMLEKWESVPQAFITSAEKGVGREEILSYLEELNNTVTL